MQWYYEKGGQTAGPVSDNDFRALVFRGEITRQTLVWHQKLDKWTAYGRIPPEAAPGGKPPLRLATPAHPAECARCGKTFDMRDMTETDGAYVCPECQSAAPAEETGTMNYAGFWIRFVAKLIDGIVLSILAGVITTLGFSSAFGLVIAGNIEAALRAFSLAALILMALNIAYNVLFVGKFGATPGKMVLRLRIVRADGSPVSYGRAAGRFFAEWLSAIILNIGYIMAGFDDEKRALHDRLCDTRVVKS